MILARREACTWRIGEIQNGRREHGVPMRAILIVGYVTESQVREVALNENEVPRRNPIRGVGS